MEFSCRNVIGRETIMREIIAMWVSLHVFMQGRRQLAKSGGANSTIARCRRQCIEARSADQSARSAENFFAFIFWLSGWALVAPSCFVLQIRDASPQETR